MLDLAKTALAWVRSNNYIDMTTRQLAFLAVVCDEDGPHYVREVARKMKVSKPVITRVVDHFEAEGWVQRLRDPDDGRSVILEATMRGRRERCRLQEITP
jgi:DNA-binding MarR family transcriptional regulator